MRKILIYLIVVIFIITIFPSCSDENLIKLFLKMKYLKTVSIIMAYTILKLKTNF